MRGKENKRKGRVVVTLQCPAVSEVVRLLTTELMEMEEAEAMARGLMGFLLWLLLKLDAAGTSLGMNLLWVNAP